MNDHDKTVALHSGESREGHPREHRGAPGDVKPNGQHSDYWVLSEEDRAKGFVRPVRRTYKHVGARPTHPTRPLTADEQARNTGRDYVVFEPCPADSTITGRYWTQAQLDSGCGSTTTMSQAIAETYARDPKFYGSTFCCACGAHFPVAEFTWSPNGRDGSDELVGA